MKALILHLEFPPIIGGGGRYTQNLVKGIAAEGVEVVLLTSGDTDSTEKVDDNLLIKRFRNLKDLYDGKGDVIEAVDILVRQIKEEMPDLIHTEHSLETLIGQAANLNFGLPHFVTHHKTPFYDNTKNFEINGKWSLYNYVNTTQELRFIEPSEAFKNALLQSGVDPKNIDVVYPGVDQKVFTHEISKFAVSNLRAQLKINEDDFVILLPCLIRKRKGLEFILQAVSKVSYKNIKVIITGKPSNQKEREYYKKLENLLEDDLLVKHDVFSDQDMPVLYNLANVTVLASEAEGLGISLLEAMSCGCPVIGSNVMGINEVIKDGFNGVMCEYGDVEELSNLIGKLYKNSDFGNEITKNAFQSLEKKFNLKKQAQNHIQVYDKYVGSVRQSSGGVLYMIVDDKLELYLAKHSEYGYVLPKGTKEKGETWLETATREINEESGYIVNIPTYKLGVIKWSFGPEGGEKINKECMFYAFQVGVNAIAGEQQIEEGELVEKGEWLEYGQAVKVMAHKTERDVVKKLHKWI